MSQENNTSAIEHANVQLEAGRHEDVGEQYLTFFMNKEEFGVDILSVQEIRGWEPITPIPNAPRQVLGFTNLRGTVAPIIDLRLSFGVKDISYEGSTVVIILSIQTEREAKIMGIVVDAVSDVYNFAQSHIQPSPELAQTKQAQYVKGLGSTDEKMVILLELTEQLIADSEVVADRQVAGSNAS